MRVLIVDDEEELVSSVVERLQLRGIEAQGSTRGADALQRLSQQSFDVVLVDVKMPGMGGLDLAREIKRREPSQQVVMLTGHGSAEHAGEGLELGAFDYLMKPVKLDDLLEVLSKAAAATPEDSR